MSDRCPDCGLNWEIAPPARIDQLVDDSHGGGKFVPGPWVRCVGCKREYLLQLHSIAKPITFNETT
jgi:hypothetical protein